MVKMLPDNINPKISNKLIILFRLSMGIFILLSLFLSGCSDLSRLQPQISSFSNHTVEFITRSPEVRLRRALEDMNQPHPIIQQAFEENTIITENWNQAKIKKISPNLYWVDYNSGEVCGHFGCLYSLYEQKSDSDSSNHLWSGYLQPYTPPKKPLLQVNENDSDHPCLQFYQVEEKNYIDLTYCFDGNQYKIINSHRFIN